MIPDLIGIDANPVAGLLPHHPGKKKDDLQLSSVFRATASGGDHAKPLPILQGAHSLAHDMKFGWKPELSFESAPIPLYFNFVDQPLI